MAKTYRYAAYGWADSEDLEPALLLGRYRTKLGAQIAAWRFRRRAPRAHAWIRAEHVVAFVEEGRGV